MSVSLFSVCLGSIERAPFLADLVETMIQIEQGINRLMNQLHLTSQLELRRTICPDRKEWVEVSLIDGAQMNLFERLDTAGGMNLTIPEIEGAALSFQVRRAVQTLHYLHRARVWQSDAFKETLETLNPTEAVRTITHHWPRDHGQLSLRTPDGLTTSTNVPNRFFSMRSDQPVRLTFRAREVGRHSATVTMDNGSTEMIRAKSRSIRVAWSASDALGTAQVLIDSAMAETWMTGLFNVVRNRHNQPKSLLLLNSTSLECFASRCVPSQ
jgi:hypothetical protein